MRLPITDLVRQEILSELLTVMGRHEHNEYQGRIVRMQVRDQVLRSRQRVSFLTSDRYPEYLYEPPLKDELQLLKDETESELADAISEGAPQEVIDDLTLLLESICAELEVVCSISESSSGVP